MEQRADAGTPRRRWIVAGIVAAVVIVVGVVAANVVGDRGGSGDGQAAGPTARASSPRPPAAVGGSPSVTADSHTPLPEATHPELAWTETSRFEESGLSRDPADFAVGSGMAVAVGSALLEAEVPPGGAARREGRVWVASEPANWEEIVDPEQFQDAILTDVITAADGTFIALGRIEGEGVTPVALATWRSEDGRTWERADIGLPPTLSSRGVADGSEGYVVAGVRTDAAAAVEVWHSTDGLSWGRVFELPSVEEPDGRDIQNVEAGAEGFVAHGSHRDGRIYFVASGDGREWVDAPRQPALDELPSVPPLASLGGDWLAAERGGSDPLGLWFSPDGLNWSRLEITAPGPGARFDRASWLASAGDRLFLEGNDPDRIGETWTSTDGREWTLTDLPAELSATAVIRWDDRLALAGTLPVDRSRAASFWIAPAP